MIPAKASGLIPIQLEYYYFEFQLKRLEKDSEVIIGCQIHGHELDQSVGENTYSFGLSSKTGQWVSWSDSILKLFQFCETKVPSDRRCDAVTQNAEKLKALECEGTEALESNCYTALRRKAFSESGCAFLGNFLNLFWQFFRSEIQIKSGDYVGMFINRDEQWAAFVHNGKVTEKAFTDFPSVPLAPCVTIKVLYFLPKIHIV